jgi:hypothetical protein
MVWSIFHSTFHISQPRNLGTALLAPQREIDGPLALWVGVTDDATILRPTLGGVYACPSGYPRGSLVDIGGSDRYASAAELQAVAGPNVPAAACRLYR